MDLKLMIPSYFGGYGPPARFRARNNPVDAKKYDFRSNRTFSTLPNTIVESGLHMLMFGLGGGLVVLHAAYMECGIWTSLGVNVILAVIIGYCVCILVWSAQKLYGRVLIPTLTYPDIMEATALLSPWPWFRKMSRCLRYLIEGTLMIHLYGSCCVLVIMIARNLKELVSGDSTICDGDEPPLKVYILSLMLPCAVICMVTDLKILAPFALICDLFSVGLIIVTLWYGFHDSKESPLDRLPFRSVMGLFEFTSVCTFVLEPVSYALPIENNMDEPKKFPRVVLFAMPINTVSMMTIGFVGYWHYGSYAVAPITVHFPFSPFAVTLKVALCIILYVIYSMCFYVAFDIEWFYLKRNHQMSNYWFWERLYRALHVVVLTTISYGLPNVTRLMGIIGAFCTSPAVFIYPPLIELILDWEYPGLGRFKWRLLKFIAFLLLGLSLVCAGTYYNTLGMYLELKSKASQRPNMSYTPCEEELIFSYVSRRKPTNNAFYTDLQRKDINYNLTYNVSNELPFYPSVSSWPFGTGHAIRNYDFNGLLPYNITNDLFYHINNMTTLVNNTDNILPDYDNVPILINETVNNSTDYNNAFTLLTTTTILPHFNNLTAEVNNLLQNNNITVLLLNSTTTIMPYINNVTILINNVTNMLPN